MGSRLTGYFFCALAMIGVGSTVVASKLIAHGLPPFAATALRFAIAFPLFVLIMKLTGEVWPRVSRREAWLLVLQSGSGSVGYTVLLLSGMRLTSATDAGVIAGTLPAVAALVAIVALRERPGALTLGAVALATAGVLVCTVHAGDPSTRGAPGASASTLVGDAFVLLAVVCEALFILLNKRLKTPVSPLQMSTLMSGIGLALSLVPALLERPWTLRYDGPALAGVVYYALVPTVAGFMLWFAGAARIAGAQASALTAFVPISAAAFAAIVLHEAIGAAQWWAIGCVLGAVLLIACDGARANARKTESRRAARVRIG
ncbi:DMT family transporter [Trinickia sp. NRRL B-1857]|uniref:DMT family transporter n=1 Tax=Trinickia sp. NRRL B-1857 TaxID=3162879 RepID=UPI003D2CEFB5